MKRLAEFRKAGAVLAIIVLGVMVCEAAQAGTIAGSIKVEGEKDLSDFLVYIADLGGREFPPPEKSVRVDQKDLTFIPRVVPILVGTTVDFLNSDDVIHNVFSPSTVADRFNLGEWPKGVVRSRTFTRPGVVVLLCRIHTEMEGFIVVLPNPYFTRVNEKGEYVLEGVPRGVYDLATWHPYLLPIKKSVEVREGEIVRVDFTFE